MITIKSLVKALTFTFVVVGMLLSSTPRVLANTSTPPTTPAPDKASFRFTDTMAMPNSSDTLTCDGVAGPESFENVPQRETYYGQKILWAHWDSSPNTVYGIDTYGPDNKLIHRSSVIKPYYYRFYGFGYNGEGTYKIVVRAKNTQTGIISSPTTCKLTYQITPTAPDFTSFRFTDSMDTPTESDTLTCNGVWEKPLLHMPNNPQYNGMPFVWAHWQNDPTVRYGIDTYAPDGTLMHHSSPIKPNDYRFYGFGSQGDGVYKMTVYGKSKTTGALSAKTHCKLKYEAPVVEPTLVITAPEENESISGKYTFTADYQNGVTNTIQWAIRKGTCAMGTNTVAGNVDGYHDSSDFTSPLFSTTLDTTSWDDGDYCFVVNPKEPSGNTNLRETLNFTINNTASFFGLRTVIDNELDNNVSEKNEFTDEEISTDEQIEDTNTDEKQPEVKIEEESTSEDKKDSSKEEIVTESKSETITPEVKDAKSEIFSKEEVSTERTER